jgi:hypothetical protein
VIYPLSYQASAGSASSAGLTGFPGAIFQGGIGLMFDGKYERAQAPDAPMK